MVNIENIKVSLFITLMIGFIHLSIYLFLMELKKHWEADLKAFLERLEEEGAKIETQRNKQIKGKPKEALL
ncbi:hypothetical protein [Bacillus sp. NPDC094106]|uniref:hypothetical protein n=1 Tax=Bacillus sp. NPDC094106 TaxID=3363949 RepID=UPI003811E218